jgi:hypothetical protein
MEYRVLNQGVTGKRKLYPITENLYNKVDDPSKDYYSSIFIYNEEHNKQLKETGSLAGCTGVTTDLLAFDLDSRTDLELARREAIMLSNRLMDCGIPMNSLQLAFSGGKGFSIVVKTNKRFTLEEFRNLHSFFSKDLTTSDSTIVDSQRIFRVVGTKHNATKFYKFPLNFEQLSQLSVDKIQDLALDMDNADPSLIQTVTADLPNYIYDLRLSKVDIKPTIITDSGDIDFTKKPKGFSNCKWALLEGLYGEGQRNTALTVLAATCRGLGFNKEITYNMLKASNRIQSTRCNTEPLSKKEIWTTSIDSVFKPTWDGGTYSCKKPGFLQDYCNTLGSNKCKHNEDVSTIQTHEVFDLFQNYATNFDKNVLNTGIKQLDERCKLLVGTSSGILAPPGVGKTSISLSILNHNSNKNVNCLMYSYDMFSSMLYLRLIQKHTNYSQDKIFDIFKNKKPEHTFIKETLEKEYNKVNFCFKSGQTPDEIEQTLIDTEQKIGDKVKLIIIDYNELVIASTSDPTQASAQVAQRLRQIANDREVCILTLLQPSKLYANPGDEIKSYQGAKGSSAIAQSLTLMLSLSRPGFSPRNPEQDKFISINCLKNRNGPLFTIDMGWDGLTGSVTDLSDDDLYELKTIREKKELESSNSNGMSF